MRYEAFLVSALLSPLRAGAPYLPRRAVVVEPTSANPAFVKALQTHPDLEAVLAWLQPYCKSDWLQCETNADGTLRIASGSFSVALFAKLRNDAASAVSVYAVTPAAEVLSPAKSLPVVIKIPLEAAQVRNLNSASPKIPVLRKEVLRSRAASSYHFANNIPVGPASYVVRIRATGELHPIQRIGYIQEQLDGVTALDLFRLMLHNEVVMISASYKAFLGRFAAYIRMYRQQDAKKKQQGKIQHSSSTTVLSRTWREVEAASLQASMELRDQLQQRLVLAEALFETADQLWKAGLMHCDSHPGNMMILRQVIKNVEIVDKERRSIRRFIPGVQRHSRRMSQRQKGRIQKTGVPVFALQHQNIRYIDTGGMLELKPLLREISKAFPGEPPEKHLSLACPMYRDFYADDLTVLAHFIPQLALDSGFKEDVQKYLRQTPHLAAMLNMYEDWRSGKWLPVGDRPLQEKWKQLFSWIHKLDEASTKIIEILKSTRKAMEQAMLRTKCKLAGRILEGAPKDITREPTPWKSAHQLVGSVCSLQTLQGGIREMQSAILKARAEIGNAAPTE